MDGIINIFSFDKPLWIYSKVQFTDFNPFSYKKETQKSCVSALGFTHSGALKRQRVLVGFQNANSVYTAHPAQPATLQEDTLFKAAQLRTTSHGGVADACLV